MVSDDGQLRDGAVGLVTAGEWVGYFVLLEREREDFWTLYWRNPVVPLESLRIDDDVGGETVFFSDDAARHWLYEELSVRWLLGEERERRRKQFFAFEEPPSRSALSRLMSLWKKRW